MWHEGRTGHLLAQDSLEDACGGWGIREPLGVFPEHMAKGAGPAPQDCGPPPHPTQSEACAAFPDRHSANGPHFHGGGQHGAPALHQPGENGGALSYMLGPCCSYEAGSPVSPLNPGLGSSRGARAMHGTEGFAFGGRVLGGGCAGLGCTCARPTAPQGPALGRGSHQLPNTWTQGLGACGQGVSVQPWGDGGAMMGAPQEGEGLGSNVRASDVGAPKAKGQRPVPRPPGLYEPHRIHLGPVPGPHQHTRNLSVLSPCAGRAGPGD